MDYFGLAQKYDTPLYIYDFDKIALRYNDLKQAFSGRKSLVCYAVKANSNLSLLKFLASLGAGFDCVSVGEIKRALIAGAKPYQMIFSGVGKRDDEIKYALTNDILMINLESEAELERVENIARELQKVARVSIRVNPDVDANTHPYISTGLNENKFGVDIDTAKKMYIKAKKSDNLQPIGIHFHIGSQITDISSIIQASGIVSKLLTELKSVDIDIKFFDIGGGIGIVYNDERDVSLYDYAQGILKNLSGHDITIVCEPGRFLVGNAGEFLTKVLYEKRNKDKRFVVVDGAMNDLLRPSLYNAYHGISVVGKDKNHTSCDVVGPICESGDFLAKNIKLPICESGDLIVVKSAGAYGFSMSSNYNTRPRVAEVAIISNKDKLIRKRESFDDVIALEKECLE
ncbi:diaminopimelate decarboxylase [Campylobacter pinnipediorum subsp. caledonicus]|uniref:diaminopimelate decarboxylase n=1 Tax=Campylobacter pinnipediorum TaxID=1965231 RepID=UPI000995CC0B|nr:diaminopimelate decarboxylase [Campylobacter pinnipediorum]AQW86658.1 diaminopimelate decarboxylase [Campylobacter pinnipediorum subsp. caledonicus]